MGVSQVSFKVLQTCDGGWLRTSVANVTISERYVKCFWWVKLSTGVWPELNVPADGAFPPFHDLAVLVNNAVEVQVVVVGVALRQPAGLYAHAGSPVAVSRVFSRYASAISYSSRPLGVCM